MPEDITALDPNLCPAVLNENNIAVFATTVSDSNFNLGMLSIGGSGISNNSSSNVGAIAVGVGDTACVNTGLIGQAFGIDADFNFGLHGRVYADEGGVNVGVLGDITGTGVDTGRLNIGLWGVCDSYGNTNNNNWAGYFSGDVYTTSSQYYSSDQKFKKDITELTDVLDKIRGLGLYSFQYNTTEFPQMSFSTGKHYGVIAQELQETFPELVRTTLYPKVAKGDVVYPSLEFKTVNYIEFIPIILKAIQELTDKIDAISTATGNLSPEEVTALSSAVLYQNVPNPYHSETTIQYYIPDDISQSLMVIMNLEGQVVAKYSNLKKGKQQLSIKAGNLIPGTYYYTLFCDNDLVATKKMIIMK